MTRRATSAASRPRRPARCTPGRWSRRSRSWLDARAHARPLAGAHRGRGRPALRRAGAAEEILGQLEPAAWSPTSRRCGSRPASPPTSRHSIGWWRAACLSLRLHAGGHRCPPRRRARAAARRHAERVYPGTCRDGPARQAGARRACAIRATQRRGRCVGEVIWLDRRLGAQHAGRRARGRRLRAPARRRRLGLPARGRGRRCGQGDHARRARRRPGRQHAAPDPAAAALGLPTPRYLHTPLVLAANGEKLSKQNGARTAGPALTPLAALQAAGTVLGLEADGRTPADWLAGAVERWRRRWPLP